MLLSGTTPPTNTLKRRPRPPRTRIIFRTYQPRNRVDRHGGHDAVSTASRLLVRAGKDQPPANGRSGRKLPCRTPQGSVSRRLDRGTPISRPPRSCHTDGRHALQSPASNSTDELRESAPGGDPPEAPSRAVESGASALLARLTAHDEDNPEHQQKCRRDTAANREC